MTKTKLERAYRKAAVNALIHEEEINGLTDLINDTVTESKKEKESAPNAPLEDNPTVQERNHHGK